MSKESKEFRRGKIGMENGDQTELKALVERGENGEIVVEK